MAGEEKKKTDLKSRLKRTEVGGAPVTANPNPDAGIVPPDFGAPAPLAAPPMVGGDVPNIAPPPMDFGAPNVPGLGDIAPPDFIRQQQAARAEAEARMVAEAQARAVAEARAAAIAAAAADPFGSSSMQNSPQEVRLVIDEKSVSDAEVGRKNTGVIFGIVATGVVMLGAGYLMGGFIEQRSQANRTTAALTDIRRSVDEAGAAITMLKDKLDRAATSAGIGEAAPGQAAAPAGQPAANARIDTDLPTWFLQQPPDPPLTAEAYANRVGRLRPDLVNKLMKTQIELSTVWGEMRRHSERTQHDAALITASLHDAQTARGELARLMVVFARGPSNGPPVMGTIVGYSAGEGAGPYTIAPVLPGAPTRTIYSEGDLATPALLGTVAIPVSATGGTPALAVRGMGQPWSDYTNRLRNLKALVDELAQDHHSLAEALSH